MYVPFPMFITVTVIRMDSLHVSCLSLLQFYQEKKKTQECIIDTALGTTGLCRWEIYFLAQEIYVENLYENSYSQLEITWQGICKSENLFQEKKAKFIAEIESTIYKT